MQVYNPTENPITVSIKGTEYSLGAESTIKGVKESHAEYWKEMLHNFIEVTPEDVKEKSIPKVSVAEVVAAVDKVEPEVKTKK